MIGTATDPVIAGRASVNGGDLIFMGNRYVLQSATIAFVNTTETQPLINLQATTTVQQYNINLRFHGPLDRLQTNYTSDPALAPADIIHLLAFGTTEEAANAAPPTATTLGAESLIASQVTSQITNRVQKVAGISQLSVDPAAKPRNLLILQRLHEVVSAFRNHSFLEKWVTSVIACGC